MAGFYSARGRTIPPLPWPVFAPPLSVRAMWDLMQKMGLEPVSVKYHPDGTFRIMTAKHAEINKPPHGPSGSAGSVENPWDSVL